MSGGTITPEDWLRAHRPSDEKESEEKVSVELLSKPIIPVGWCPNPGPARPIIQKPENKSEIYSDSSL